MGGGKNSHRALASGARCARSTRSERSARNTVCTSWARNPKDFENIGPTWRHLGPSWRHLGPSCISEPMFAQLAPLFAHLRPLFAHLRRALAHLNRDLKKVKQNVAKPTVLSNVFAGSNQSPKNRLEKSVAPILGHLGTILAQLGATLTLSWLILELIFAQLAPCSLI